MPMPGVHKKFQLTQNSGLFFHEERCYPSQWFINGFSACCFGQVIRSLAKTKRE